MGDKFEMVTAFSREGPKKVYVQHRLKEYAAAVNELINKKAYFYTCGDASNMARDVNATLVQIIAEGRDVPEQKAEQIVKSMRGANQYQVRHTASQVLNCPSCFLLTHCRRTSGKHRVLQHGGGKIDLLPLLFSSLLQYGILKTSAGGLRWDTDSHEWTKFSCDG